MQLTALVPESSSHPFAQATRPAGARLRKDTDVETNRSVDVPNTERGDEQRYSNDAGEVEGRVQINGFLVDRRRTVGPPEDVVTPENEN